MDGSKRSTEMMRATTVLTEPSRSTIFFI